MIVLSICESNNSKNIRTNNSEVKKWPIHDFGRYNHHVKKYWTILSYARKCKQSDSKIKRDGFFSFLIEHFNIKINACLRSSAVFINVIYIGNGNKEENKGAQQRVFVFVLDICGFIYRSNTLEKIQGLLTDCNILVF